MKVAWTHLVAAPRFRDAKSAESRHAISGASRERTARTCSRGNGLCQDPVNHVAGNVREPEIAPLIAIGEPLVIDP
ncbi:hypothetical protein I41_38560 [Lacipirellula limnantheis]|uniref:Uncharacterized protein n=1 Tax=Lacipirellula limnantheis TaxID=2528024 RepID=A0A517U208_9BACT|nr:hypothetical protein I41_38560 [Lacipirellula limnantheis]